MPGEAIPHNRSCTSGDGRGLSFCGLYAFYLKTPSGDGMHRWDKESDEEEKTIKAREASVPGLSCAPGRIRTCDLQSRSLTLYPTELRALNGRSIAHSVSKVKRCFLNSANQYFRRSFRNKPRQYRHSRRIVFQYSSSRKIGLVQAVFPCASITSARM